MIVLYRTWNDSAVHDSAVPYLERGRVVRIGKGLPRLVGPVEIPQWAVAVTPAAVAAATTNTAATTAAATASITTIFIILNSFSSVVINSSTTTNTTRNEI